ncbi:MAG: rhomboid family intramembrane serine protease [Bacillota bacterium]
MIPLRDTIRSRTFPIVTVSLIIINIIIFFYEASLPQAELAELAGGLGVIPARDLTALLHNPLNLTAYIPFFTAMFLHGGWFHVLGNMLYLWVFGDNIEDSMGRGRFIIYYLLTGVIGSVAHIFANPGSAVPTIGASGAIAGVLGGYLVSFPRSRVLTLVPFFFVFLVEIPATFFIVLWFGMQLLNGVASIAIPGETVAWWAHIGGFVSGAILIRFFLR